MTSKVKARLSFARITKNSPSLSDQEATDHHAASCNDSSKSPQKTEKSTAKDSAPPVHSAPQPASVVSIAPVARHDRALSQLSHQLSPKRRNSHRQHNFMSYIFGPRPNGKSQLPRNNKGPGHRGQLSYHAHLAPEQRSRALVRSVSTDSFARFASSYDPSYARPRCGNTKGRSTSISSSDFDLMQPSVGRLQVVNGPISPLLSNDYPTSRTSRGNVQTSVLYPGPPSPSKHSTRQSAAGFRTSHLRTQLPVLNVSPSTPPVERPGNRLRVVNRSGSMNTLSTSSSAFKSPPLAMSHQDQRTSTQLSRAHTVHQSPLPRDYQPMPLSSSTPFLDLKELPPEQLGIKGDEPEDCIEGSFASEEQVEGQNQRVAFLSPLTSETSPSSSISTQQKETCQPPLARRDLQSGSNGSQTIKSASSSMETVDFFLPNEKEENTHSHLTQNSRSLQASRERLSRFLAFRNPNNTATGAKGSSTSPLQKKMAARQNEDNSQAAPSSTLTSQAPQISTLLGYSFPPKIHTSLTPYLFEIGDHTLETRQSGESFLMDLPLDDGSSNGSSSSHEPAYTGVAAPVQISNLNHFEYVRLFQGRSLKQGDLTAAEAALAKKGEPANNLGICLRKEDGGAPSSDNNNRASQRAGSNEGSHQQPGVVTPISRSSSLSSSPSTDQYSTPNTSADEETSVTTGSPPRSRNGATADSRPSFIDVSISGACNSFTQEFDPWFESPNQQREMEGNESDNGHKDQDQLNSASSPEAVTELRRPVRKTSDIPPLPPPKPSKPATGLHRPTSQRIKTGLQKALSIRRNAA